MNTKDIKIEIEERKEYMNMLKEFFLSTFEMDFSDLKATLLLDFIVEQMGPSFYNKALNDVHFLMSDKLSDIYILEKSPKKSKK